MTRKRGPGRPPADDKAEHPVFFRLTAEEFEERTKAAKRAGYPTVHAWAKALVLAAR